MMKIMLKILCAPVIALLCIFVWLCSGLLYCTAWVFGIISALIGILGIAVLATYSPKNGIILLVIAFLVSPVGIPMAAAWLLGIIQQIRFAIQDMLLSRQPFVILAIAEALREEVFPH
jgi:MFS family permease